VCCDPDCCMSCTWAFKEMCHFHVHVFHVIRKLNDVLIKLAGRRIFIMVFGLKESSLTNSQ
jgi:hypothetical protein